MTEWPFAGLTCRDCGVKTPRVQRRGGVESNPPLCNACCAKYSGADWLRRRLEAGVLPNHRVHASKQP